jgi:hypothetical protein
MKSQGIGCTDINAADHPRRLHYKEYTLSTWFTHIKILNMCSAYGNVDSIVLMALSYLPKVSAVCKPLTAKIELFASVACHCWTIIQVATSHVLKMNV